MLRRLLLGCLLAVLVVGCGATVRPHGWISHVERSRALTACVSGDCGPYAVTFDWVGVTVASRTGYYVSLNGTQVADISSATQYTFVGIDCGVTSTFGVEAHDSSGVTGSQYSYSYTAPACAAGNPVNTAEPVVTGTVATGDVLSTTTGAWANSPTSYTYQWQDCGTDGTGCSNINGATSSTYTVASGDAGHTIEAAVTAHNASGATAANAPIVPAVDTFTSDTTLDTNVWSALNQQGDTSNSEPQCYQPVAHTLGGSGLVQTITYSSGGYTCPAGTPGSTNPLNYRSGAIQMKSVAFTYGTVVVRAEMAGGSTHSSWPTIWLLGSACQTSSTSPFTYLSGTSGTLTGFYCPWDSDNSSAAEVDIAECLKCDSTTVSVNEQLHDSDSTSDAHQCLPTLSNVTTNFHNYELDWAAGSMTWKVDGTTECTISGAGSVVPSHPMFLLVTSAVCTSGTPCGGSAGSTGWPATTTIAWVHVSH